MPLTIQQMGHSSRGNNQSITKERRDAAKCESPKEGLQKCDNPPLHSCSSWLARAMSRHARCPGHRLGTAFLGGSAYQSLAHMAIKQPHMFNKDYILVSMCGVKCPESRAHVNYSCKYSSPLLPSPNHWSRRGASNLGARRGAAFPSSTDAQTRSTALGRTGCESGLCI